MCDEYDFALKIKPPERSRNALIARRDVVDPDGRWIPFQDLPHQILRLLRLLPRLDYRNQTALWVSLSQHGAKSHFPLPLANEALQAGYHDDSAACRSYEAPHEFARHAARRAIVEPDVGTSPTQGKVGSCDRSRSRRRSERNCCR
jgi:hypothetical protein